MLTKGRGAQGLPPRSPQHPPQCPEPAGFSPVYALMPTATVEEQREDGEGQGHGSTGHTTSRPCLDGHWLSIPPPPAYLCSSSPLLPGSGLIVPPWDSTGQVLRAPTQKRGGQWGSASRLGQTRGLERGCLLPCHWSPCLPPPIRPPPFLLPCWSLRTPCLWLAIPPSPHIPPPGPHSGSRTLSSPPGTPQAPSLVAGRTGAWAVGSAAEGEAGGHEAGNPAPRRGCPQGSTGRSGPPHSPRFSSLSPCPLWWPEEKPRPR